MLSLQGAGFPGPNLLERLGSSASGAIRGGALVAWATAEGLRALIETESIAEVVGRQGMHLVIGTDAVTNLRSLSTLKHIQSEHEAFGATFFVNPYNELFHPKLYWFQYADGSGVIVVGSGNLTRAGLTSNWEASAALPASAGEMVALLQRIDAFLAQHRALLFTAEDDEVRDRVALNRVVRARLPEAAEAALPVLGLDALADDPTVGAASSADWLISELSKSRKDRRGRSLFSQSSFPVSVARDFFGWTGDNRDLQLVAIDAESGEVIDVRIGTMRFKPNSTNPYLELASVQGVPYPNIGNPIAAFHRVMPDRFEYLVSMPGGAHHETLEAIIDRRAFGVLAGLKMRVVLEDADIREEWPSAPI